MTRVIRVDGRCRSCSALPKVRVTHAESHRLPSTWRPIAEHPTLRPGPWVPRGEMKGVVFCTRCETLWLLFLDPGHFYYTDVIELAPELSALVSEDSTLEDVLPLVVSADTLLQLMIRDWFALASYDASDAAQALITELGRPGLSTRLAMRLLDFLAAVISGIGRRQKVVVEDASALVAVCERRDFRSLDEARRASERNEIERLVAGVARAAFSSAFGFGPDRLQTSPDARSALLAVARRRGLTHSAQVLAPPGASPQPKLLDGVEQLVSEIEELLRDGVSRVTHQELEPIVGVVRAFWDRAEEASFAPRSGPSLGLYQRCRDLLLSLRHADLIPNESVNAVEDALVAS